MRGPWASLGPTGGRWAAPGHGRCRDGCPRLAAVSWDRPARAVATRDAWPCAAPAPADGRPGTAVSVRSALPGGTEAPRSHSGTSGVGDSRSRRQLGFCPRSEGLLHPGQPQPSTLEWLSFLPRARASGPRAVPSPPLPVGTSTYQWSGAVQVERAWGGGVSPHPLPQRGPLLNFLQSGLPHQGVWGEPSRGVP